jgi:hypothetical protein
MMDKTGFEVEEVDDEHENSDAFKSDDEMDEEDLID